MIFEKGMEVSYKEHSGSISFICENYISILVRKGDHRSQDVNVLIFRSDFSDVVLTNGK